MDAEITTEHTASSYGIPVLVVYGQAVGSAETGDLVLIEATAEEVAALERGGYALADEMPRSAP